MLVSVWSKPCCTRKIDCTCGTCISFGAWWHDAMCCFNLCMLCYVQCGVKACDGELSDVCWYAWSSCAAKPCNIILDRVAFIHAAFFSEGAVKFIESVDHWHHGRIGERVKAWVDVGIDAQVGAQAQARVDAQQRRKSKTRTARHELGLAISTSFSVHLISSSCCVCNFWIVHDTLTLRNRNVSVFPHTQSNRLRLPTFVEHAHRRCAVGMTGWSFVIQFCKVNDGQNAELIEIAVSATE